MSLTEIINKSILYVEKNDYKSYDVFDALTNPFLDRRTKKTPFIRRIAIQINAKSPLNLRFVGMKRMIHTKTISDMLSSYAMLFRTTADKQYLLRANTLYELLDERKLGSTHGFGWGLNFPYTTRFVDASEDTPNLYNTINCLTSIIDYYSVTGYEHLEEVITDCVNFIVEDFGVIYGQDDDAWIRYYPGQTHPTYNVNALTISAFFRINMIFKRDIVSPILISKLINNIVQNQNDNGSWYYALSKQGEWVDGFHTGFILESLSMVYSLHGDEFNIQDSLMSGIRYYVDNLFSKDGVPQYYPHERFPIESQNCAQAIQTLANIDQLGFDNTELLTKVIENVTANLYKPEGYFIHKVGKFYKNKQIYFRWSQTPMILALLHAQEYLKK